jgi:hypothetical protein
MPNKHVEITRAFTATFNAGDVETLISCCHPSVEFHSTFAAVGGEVYHGIHREDALEALGVSEGALDPVGP